MIKFDGTAGLYKIATKDLEEKALNLICALRNGRSLEFTESRIIELQQSLTKFREFLKEEE